MKECKKVYQYICENLDQDLDSPACLEIRRHMEGCADCTAYLDSLKKTVYLYKAMPSPEVPHALHTRLVRSITPSRIKPRTQLHRSTKVRRHKAG